MVSSRRVYSSTSRRHEWPRVVLRRRVVLELEDRPRVTLPSVRCVMSSLWVGSDEKRGTMIDVRPQSHRAMDRHCQCSSVAEKQLSRCDKTSPCMTHPRPWRCDVGLSTKQKASLMDLGLYVCLLVLCFVCCLSVCGFWFFVL